MSGYCAVKFQDENEDPWIEVPKLWLTRDDDDDDSDDSDDDDNDDYRKCWCPRTDFWYKAENKIIFNGSTKGWYLRDLVDVDKTEYASLSEAGERATVLNRQDLEDRRYDQLIQKLSNVEAKVDMRNYDIGRILQQFQLMKGLMAAIQNPAPVEIVKPTLVKLLPIKKIKDLKKFELKFLNENWISPALTELIGILTDEQKINESVSRILETIFSRELAVQCTWDGNDGLKIKDLLVTKKIEATLKNINPEYDGLQRAVTSWFESNRKSTMLPD